MYREKYRKTNANKDDMIKMKMQCNKNANVFKMQYNANKNAIKCKCKMRGKMQCDVNAMRCKCNENTLQCKPLLNAMSDTACTTGIRFGDTQPDGSVIGNLVYAGALTVR